MHRYMEVRKKALGVKEMHVYDMHVSLVENADLKLDYEDAYKLVLEGLAPLGKEYISLLKEGKEKGWIDVCETEGKRSGAYSIGIYGNHPYVLLNYQKTTHDVFTIAHEIGHSLKSYFSNKNQQYAKCDYVI
ncbi:MAG: oligoendopeptidase F, partial [Clostridiales bacterium]|nr:oligoendopeptidase F [Clostridiales bacterium]